MDQLGRFAPAFGLIGTLVGLIIMLSHMSKPEVIGPAMAVALITTLYGAVIANLFCLPFSEKLQYLSKQELLSVEIVIRGVLAIQSGENPRVIRQRLRSFVPTRSRDSDPAKPAGKLPADHQSEARAAKLACDG